MNRDHEFDLVTARRYREHVEPISSPFVQLLVQFGGAVEGSSVLDLACGPGFVALAAAEHVGPGGRVVGVDADPAMIEAAVESAADGRVEWVVARADALPLPDDSIDVVLCQQGAQFFPDLPAALREAARVLRPGGRLAATVWAPVQRSPYLDALTHALRVVVGVEPERALAAFSTGAGQLVESAGAAGFAEVEAQDVVRTIRLPDLPEHAAGHLSALPRSASAAPEVLAAAARAITDRMSEHRGPDGAVEVVFTSVLLTARLPR
ncbi:class I SAM-dependent methyltransferase [Umezawaea beigongshangensis]|uniref:class I SAM-dependent methyltransferase n=1 Tax=Umezawaea beigongshangensis TaxID=2780383 RepID=UPI0018F269E7|nr:class I SAM-dependent methyltransferase [Umezawaea beigongshangensis]